MWSQQPSTSRDPPSPPPWSLQSHQTPRDKMDNDEEEDDEDNCTPENSWFFFESDPYVLTEHLRTITLSDRYVIDVPSIDFHENDHFLSNMFATHNVRAFIFVYRLSTISLAEQGTVQTLVPSNALMSSSSSSSSTDMYTVSTSPSQSSVYFVQQLIQNSSASVALLHAYLNTVPIESLNPDSPIFRFYWNTYGASLEETSELFATESEIRRAHSSAAQRYQLPSSLIGGEKGVSLHYVALVPGKNGSVLLLDGRQSRPIEVGRYKPMDMMTSMMMSSSSSSTTTTRAGMTAAATATINEYNFECGGEAENVECKRAFVKVALSSIKQMMTEVNQSQTLTNLFSNQFNVLAFCGN